MEKFQDIKLNFDTGDNWFYSKKFKNELVNKLDTFKDNLVIVAKSKYPNTDVENLFNQYGELINSLSNEFDNFRMNEKKTTSDFQQLINLRINYSSTLFMNITVLSNALAHIANGKKDELRTGGGGLAASEEILKLLTKDGDFNTGRQSWDEAFRSILETINKQNEKLIQSLPFPEFKVNKRIFKNYYIWKSKCKDELKKVFDNLRKSLNEDKVIKDESLKKCLQEAFNKFMPLFNGAYSRYERIKITKISKFFSKKERDKVKNGRLDLIKQLINAISELKTSLKKLGYKSHPFLGFLKYLLDKCAKDQKHIE